MIQRDRCSGCLPFYGCPATEKSFEASSGSSGGCSELMGNTIVQPLVLNEVRAAPALSRCHALCSSEAYCQRWPGGTNSLSCPIYRAEVAVPKLHITENCEVCRVESVGKRKIECSRMYHHPRCGMCSVSPHLPEAPPTDPMKSNKRVPS